MNFSYTKTILLALFAFLSSSSKAQLEIQEVNDAQALAHKLVGDGILVSNATLTLSNTIATGFFNNRGNINLGMDSGIVLCNGGVRAMRGNGFTIASSVLADGQLALPGDADLANELGISTAELNDAVVLEFDVTPLGDSVKFNYVMSSEEYSISTVCVYNDAFALFISGPGITGNVNLARIPGTNIPVSIKNVNDIRSAGCINHPEFYVDNSTNTYFTHNGHTTVFTAVSAVQPCQTYHLKMVVADHDDDLWDTGIFIEAKSLSSSGVKIENQTPVDNGVPYLAEGCTTGGLNIYRNKKLPQPATVNLVFSGNAANGTDVNPVPLAVTIPANDSVVFVPLSAIPDNIAEGVEKFKIYISSGCISTNFFADSLEVEIRDYDTLSILPRDSAGYCNNVPVPLTASGGYTNYSWDNNSTLSATNTRTPVASPVNNREIYYCTASIGACSARDSVLLQMKKIKLLTKQDVICEGSTAGRITAAGDWTWTRPASFAIDSLPWQTDSAFSGLAKASYTIKMKDAAGCSDSMLAGIIQLFPNLEIADIDSIAAGCTPTGLGSITITAAGGNGTYQYSSNGTAFQSNSTFNLPAGSYPVTVKDGNQCIVKQNFDLNAYNNLTVDAGEDKFICESDSCRLTAVSTGNVFTWTPVGAISNNKQVSVSAHPVITTKYYVTAELGVCKTTDSVTVFVYPAPIPFAGTDTSVCHGGNIQLHGSGGVDFIWSPAALLKGDDIAEPATKNLTSFVNRFYLKVKEIHGCSSLRYDTVVVYARPPAKLYIGNDTTLAVNQPIRLTAIDVNGVGFNSFSWSPSYGLNSTIVRAPVAILDKDITYILTATTSENCIGIDSIKIKVYNGPEIYVPKAFTPNGDNRNDIMRAIAIGIREFEYFTIYNRWGKIVYTTSNPGLGWDGTINGVAQDTGTFIWIAKAVSYKGETIQRKGSFVLIR